MDNTVRDSQFILIVDDVEANRFALKDIIEEMGYRPILAENGVQALKIVKRYELGLIILDIAMPVMDGYEFCKIMKSSPDTREVPIIFISAFDDPADIIKGFELQGEDYITKPFIPEVVMARVKIHLRLSENNKRLSELNHRLQDSIREQLHMMEIEKKNVLYALTRVARENAGYDEEHMDRLCHNCRTLSEAMQLSPLYSDKISEDYINTIEIAAPLCDLGNVAVPTLILKKTTSLSEEENEIMRTHTTIGANILRDVQKVGEYNDFIQMAIDIANFHHENWDGSGYPTGIKGDDIPLAAQIVSVISEFCALTETRTYRESYSRENAVQIMQGDAGVKFNPDIFNIIRKIYRQLQ